MKRLTYSTSNGATFIHEDGDVIAVMVPTNRADAETLAEEIVRACNAGIDAPPVEGQQDALHRGYVVFRNDGSQPHEAVDLNCAACQGSGHKHDTKLPDVRAIFPALSAQGHTRTSAENVQDVLEAISKVWAA